jgi:CPA2 family monovalent cation:H+ antiporter-2
MFGVGMHFSLNDYYKFVVLPYLVHFTNRCCNLTWYWRFNVLGLEFWLALVFGLSLSCASTVVLLKALGDRGLLDSVNGKIAVGWLLVEDLVMVLFWYFFQLQLFYLVEKHQQAQKVTSNTWNHLLKVTGFIAFMLIIGKRVVPMIMQFVARLGSESYLRYCSSCCCFDCLWFLCHLWVSMALGAFFAGMVVKESDFSHRAEEETLPLREIFSILFFVSVGMLFDPHILVESTAYFGCYRDYYGG